MRMWKSWPSILSRPMKLEFEIPIDKTEEFWEHLKAGEFRTTRCNACDTLHFPPVGDCPDCGSSETEYVPLKGTGEVVAFTHIIVKPQSFQEREPYTIVVAGLVDGLNVLAWLVDADVTEVEVGMRVKLNAGLNQDGEPSYWFTPA